MSEYAGEKTLEPTPHRRQQARREGHVAKSQELGSAALLLVGLGVLTMLGGGLVHFLVEYCRNQLGGDAWLTIDASSAVDHWNGTLWTLGRYLLPILGLLCLTGVAVNVLQFGLLFLPQRLAMDFARLSPIQGLQRMFSAGSMVRLGFGLGKLAIVLAVAAVVLYKQRDALVGLAALDPSAVAVRMTQILFETVLKVGAALLVLALLDYGYQWWRHEQDLKMTAQELREELRNLEGNPEVIAKRKQTQRELVSQRRPEPESAKTQDPTRLDRAVNQAEQLTRVRENPRPHPA
jgi:flagellar biosynthesis protein FlhB